MSEYIILVEKLNAIFVLLDNFGNSRTILNTNATHYTQITTVNFDNMGVITSASIQVGRALFCFDHCWI